MITNLIWGMLGVLCSRAWQFFKQKDDEDEIQPQKKLETPEDLLADIRAHNERQAKDIFLQTLKELQCEPTVNEEEKAIYFEYQGENFFILYQDNAQFVVLHDNFWYSFDSSDINQLSYVKKVINDINWKGNLNVSYSMSEERKTVDVHTSCHMLCIENMDFKDYLKSTFRECFLVHHAFFNQLASMPTKIEE